MSTCRTCKHWGSLPPLLTDDCRTETRWEWPCPKLSDVLDIEIEYGRGYGSGDGTLGRINTPGDFGCTLHEPSSTAASPDTAPDRAKETP